MAGPFDALFELAPSETTPHLLELARRQAARRTPADLLAQLERDAYVEPGALDQRRVHEVDQLALAVSEEFEALQLSPVAPLGACSVIAPTSQDRTLSAARGLEVVSDPTNVLALLCAQRLKRAPGADVRLCSVHQVLRAQPLPKGAGFSRHFRLLTLAEAGPARAEDGFEVDAFARHVGVFERFLDGLRAQGSVFPRVQATLQSSPAREVVADRVAARLASALPRIEIARESFESTYYDGVRVLFGADAPNGEHLNLGDTGAFDWVAKLTANRRLRFVASGLGLHRASESFRSG
jgi:hypothetical protein